MTTVGPASFGLWFLTEVPPVIVVGIVGFLGTTNGVLFYLTQRFGVMPNVSYSGGPGDWALTLIIGLVAMILQAYLGQPGAMVPGWFASPLFHIVALLICFGIIGPAVNKSGMFARPVGPDTYHNFFVFPMYVYLLVAVSLPAIVVPYWYGAWGWTTIVYTLLVLALAIFFLGTLRKDNNEGRINQYEWWQDGGGRPIINRIFAGAYFNFKKP